MNILYATDLDRTLIFSQRFIDEYKPESEYSLVEEIDGKEISFMSNKVKSRLKELISKDNVEVVPVTSRSIEEFNRINIGIKFKYAIVANGGIILENGVPMQEYDDIISRDINTIELLQASLDLEDMVSVRRESKYIDNKYIFTKTTKPEEFDIEAEVLVKRYPSIQFTRQKSKVYAIPKAFNKAVALRWLQLKLGYEKIVASGDSELDLPMLAIANFAVIPEHGDLYKCGYVTNGRIAKAGIDSSIFTIDLVESLSK